MTIEEGKELLATIIKEGRTHKDYDRVTELAEEYHKLVTGDGIETMLQQITTRETAAEFKLRKEITQSIIPPVLASTKLPFQKVVRKKPLERKIDWNAKETEQKKQELDDYLQTFWGGQSLEKYLEYAFVDYNYLDPNAFILTDFDAFDPVREKAKPYPVIITSAEAIMFDLRNDEVEYLIVKQPIIYSAGEAEYEGYSFTLFLGADTIRFSERHTREDGEYEAIGGKLYLVEYFKPKAHKVPAKRIGYKRDPLTQGRTFVSAFHDIIPFLKKTLKLDSETDLSTALVAFPQRFAYVPPCPDCNNGHLPDGSECGSCGGTGKLPYHDSVMDVVTLNMPRSKEDMMPLDELLAYKSPPIDLLTFQKEYLKELRSDVFFMMFNKEFYTKAEVAATATEKVLEIDNLNDTLRPFAQALSSMWMYIVEDVATFRDLGEGIILSHKYPADFKFKTLTELMDELKKAKDADASTSTIAAIEDDINELLYADRPEELKVLRIKNSVNPFRGYSEENVRLIIAQELTTRSNAILWANLEAIFNLLEQENQQPWLYDLAHEKIIDMVKEKVTEFADQMKPAEMTVLRYDEV